MSGTVRVTAFQSAAEMLFPRLLSALRNDPQIVLECVEHDVRQGEFPALAAEYDAVIAHRPDTSQPWHGRGLRVVGLLTEPMDVALPPDHPLAGRAWLTPRDVVGLPWITVHEGFPVGRGLDALAAAAAQPARIVHRINDFHVIEAMVAAGHGVALLPRYTAGDRVSLVPLRGFRASREIEVIARRERAESPVVRRVLDALRKAARSVERAG